MQQLNTQPGDMLFLIAAPQKICYTALGQLRLAVVEQLEIVPSEEFSFVWITRFPMFEYNEEQQRYVAMHHPFTAPVEEDLENMDDPDAAMKIRARAYDLVLNGNEIGGGSIRIHDSMLQSKIFTLLGISEQEAQEKFGFLLNAFKYGAPPHGGIAFGLDRMVMLMLGLESIRDVIAFPKTTAGLSLMDGAPDKVAQQQLDDLGVRVETGEK
jgi:aspartyl-tRNA synthetase